MVFAHDTEDSLASAAALVNTALEPDSLTTIEDLDAFVIEAGWQARRARDAHELADVRSLRPALRHLWLASVAERVECINTLLAEADALPQVVRHDGFDWHLHATSHEQPLATRMAVETAMAMVDVVRMGETERLKVCDAQGCEQVFADLSRNRSRRYCSTSCSNRMAAAAYRERQSEAEPSATDKGA